MAEYYPLLAKAIGSLPNSTPESRRIVYERARKALIGQLRTLHPPVPDGDIERESVALDRAVERLEAELANGIVPGAPPIAPAPGAAAGTAPAKAQETAKPPQTTKAPEPLKAPDQASPSERPKGVPSPQPPPLPGERPVPPLRTRPPKPADTTAPGTSSAGAPATGVPTNGSPAPGAPTSGSPPLAPRPSTPRPPLGRPPVPRLPAKPGAPAAPADGGDAPPASTDGEAIPPGLSPPASTAAAQTEPASTQQALDAPIPADDSKRLKPPQRPIAPQPPGASQPKRRLWIIPVIVLALAAVVAGAAWKLRDRPELLARNKPAEQTQADKGKIAERVGEPSQPPAEPSEAEKPAPSEPPKSAEPSDKTTPAEPQQPAAPATNPNPAVPVAHRAALLVEAPDEPNKVKTFLGTVVWKIDNAPQGANAAVGLAVEADVEVPDDKLKAVVIFEKNTDASLPASHTVKVRFTIDSGSFSGSVKQIGALQMRSEASPGVESLAGATVPITTNSFLIGLSPGNAESANTELIRRLQWFDIPLMLESGKIAKLTFEKGDSGQRDLNEAFEAWQKQ